MRFVCGSLDVECAGLRHRVGRFWIPDGLHVWWGDRGVHLYWKSGPAGMRRVIFDRLPPKGAA